MKTLHFPSSAFYAGLADLLQQYDVTCEDYSLALACGLPYVFRKEGADYQTGFMVEDPEIINAYLSCHSLQLIQGRSCLPGINILKKCDRKNWYYLCERAGNMYWLFPLQSTKQAVRCYAEADFHERFADVSFYCLTTQKSSPPPVSLQKSLLCLAELENSLFTFGENLQESAVIRAFQRTHFRALLVEGVFMMKLLARPDLEGILQQLITQCHRLITVEKAVPFDILSPVLLQKLLREWRGLIKEREYRSKKAHSAV